MSSHPSRLRMPTPEDLTLMEGMTMTIHKTTGVGMSIPPYVPRNYKPAPHPLAVAIHVIGLTK